MIKSNIWLIGTGIMALEYAKVLNVLDCDFIPIGRGSKNCDDFYSITKILPFKGGLTEFLKTRPLIPDAVINTVGIEALSDTTIELLNYGIKLILLEKPGFGHPNEIKQTVSLAKNNNALVFLAYNRRFYQSVKEARKIIQKDGGVQSFNFEFTEWAHIIGKLSKHRIEHENWFYGNSTHLIDLAFFLGGIPLELSSFKKGGLEWHPSGSIFSGSGITDNGALFSYIANWESPGRWNLEICTKKHRLIFKPIEKLQILEIGSNIPENNIKIDYSLDEIYKPGIYLQTSSFLKKDFQLFLNIENQLFLYENIYNKINSLMDN